MALNWCQKYSSRISRFLLRNLFFFLPPGDVHMLPMKSFQKVLHTEGPGLWGTVCQSSGHNPCLEAASIHLFLWVPFHNIFRWLGNLMVIERASFLLVGFVGSLIQRLKAPTPSFEWSHEELRKGHEQLHLALALWSKWPAVLQGQMD